MREINTNAGEGVGDEVVKATWLKKNLAPLAEKNGGFLVE